MHKIYSTSSIDVIETRVKLFGQRSNEHPFFLKCQRNTFFSLKYYKGIPPT